MFTRIVGIALGLFLALVVTKAMNPNFDLGNYVTSTVEQAQR